MDNFIGIQGKFVTTIDNARLTNRLSHAILIEGNNANLLNSAVDYISVALMCPELKPCFTCVECQRVLNRQNTDIIYYDLSDITIKKNNILEIQSRFNKTPLEQTNKQIYIIKYIENASSIALNALLKFVEEPHKSVYAIFTTQNIDRVLPTIVSRTSVFRIKPQPLSDVINYFNTKYDNDEVSFVSKITSDEIYFETILDSEVFKLYKNNLNRLYNALKTDNFYTIFHEITRGLEKEDISILLELMYTSFVDYNNLKLLKINDEILKTLKTINNFEVCLDILISCRLKLKSNMNKELLIDQIGIEIEATCYESN